MNFFASLRPPIVGQTAARRSRRSFAVLAAGALAGLALVAAALPAAAQGYPSRPITLIVPWGAGGGTDATARIIGALLEKDLGQRYLF